MRYGPFAVLILILVTDTLPLAADAASAAEREQRAREQVAAWSRARELHDLGKLDAALAEMQKVLLIEQERNGKDSADSATVRRRVGMIYEEQDKLEAAEREYRAALAVVRKCYADNDYRVVEAKRDLEHVQRLTALSVGDRARLREATNQMHTAAGLQQQKKNSLALALLRKAVTTRREILTDDDVRYVHALTELGIGERFAGNDSDAAVAATREALEAQKKIFGMNNPVVPTSLHNLGALLTRRTEYAAAEPLLLEAVLILERNNWKDDPGYGHCQRALAQLYQNTRDYAKAEKAGTAALASLKKAYGPSGLPYLQALTVVATVYEGMDQPLRAILLMEEAIAGLRKLKQDEKPDFAMLLNKLGVEYSTAGDLAAAERMYKEALERETKSRAGSYAHAVILHSWGKCVMARGDRGRATQMLGEAIPIIRKHLKVRPLDASMEMLLMGFTYVEAGDFARAEPILLEAHEARVARSGADSVEAAESYKVLGQLYRAMSDPRRAEPYLVKTVEIRRKHLGEEHGKTGAALEELGGFYMQQHRYQEAVRTLQQARDIFRKTSGENSRDHIHSLAHLAVAYHFLKRLDVARPLYLEAIERAEKVNGPQSPQAAYARANLGMIYLAEGDYEKAEATLLKAYEIHKNKAQSTKSWVTTYSNLAELYYLTNRRDKAIEMQVQALNEQQKMLRSIFGFTAESSMQVALADMNTNFETLLTLTTLKSKSAGPDAELALTWALRRKGIVLDTLCRFRTAQRQHAADPEFRDKVKQWQQLRQRLADSALNNHGMDAEILKKRVAEWSAEAERLESVLHRTLAGVSGGLKDADIATVRGKLPAGTALVEFVRARERNLEPGSTGGWRPAHYIAFVLRADPKVSVVALDLGLSADLDKLVSQFREEIQGTPRAIRVSSEKELETALMKVSGELHKRILEPLEPHLKGAAFVYLAPDSELHRLPFEALMDSKGKYAVEGYRFAYLASGRDLLRPAAPAGKGTVVFAGPDYDLQSKDRQALVEKIAKLEQVAVRGGMPIELRGMRWKRLRGADAEAGDIQKALGSTAFGPVQTYRGEEALEEAFKAMKAPRVLHLATHGFFLPDAKRDEKEDDTNDLEGAGAAAGLSRLRKVSNPLLRSGIVLAGANALGEEGAAGEDGWVTAEEISMMDLRGTELVVLSACETGLGDVKNGEGVFGLRRAFLYAGSRTLVSSLFEVPDEQTRDFMRFFYGSMKAGKGKLDALHDAQLETIRKRRAAGEAAHPFFWASFILSGDPR
jgi:CHAT domain-containing protein/tetratricopeptide (TPR) repeat protein